MATPKLKSKKLQVANSKKATKISQDTEQVIKEKRETTAESIYDENLKKLNDFLDSCKNGMDEKLNLATRGYLIKEAGNDERFGKIHSAYIYRGGTPVARLSRERVIILDYNDTFTTLVRRRKIISDRYIIIA